MERTDSRQHAAVYEWDVVPCEGSETGGAGGTHADCGSEAYPAIALLPSHRAPIAHSPGPCGHYFDTVWNR